MKIYRFAELALVLGGMALGGPGALAQEAAAKPHIPLQKTIGRQTPTGPVPSLAVINSAGATLEEGKLTLSGVAANSIVFADRPVRAAGHVMTAQFIMQWDEGKDNFAVDPPNATISVLGGDGSQVSDAVVTLMTPVLEGDTLTFDVAVLEGSLDGATGPAAVFIDHFAGGFQAAASTAATATSAMPASRMSATTTGATTSGGTYWHAPEYHGAWYGSAAPLPSLGRCRGRGRAGRRRRGCLSALRLPALPTLLLSLTRGTHDGTREDICRGAAGAMRSARGARLRAGDGAAARPNILVIWGDDIGQFNVSAYNNGMMGYRTPNIDRIAEEGALFTDWYGQQSCTAGRAAFITGQSPIRTGLTKVGLPGAPEGMKVEDPTIAGLLRPLGYATGQFGKNHLGDRDEMLPTNNGFDAVLRQPLPPQRRGGAGEPRLPDRPGVPRALRSARGDPLVRHARRHPADRGHRPADPRAHANGGRGGHRRRARLHGPAHADGTPFFLWWNSTRMHIFTHLKPE